MEVLSWEMSNVQNSVSLKPIPNGNKIIAYRFVTKDQKDG